jgi:hypothetical protein
MPEVPRWEYFIGDRPLAPNVDAHQRRGCIAQLAAIEDHSEAGIVVLSREVIDLVQVCVCVCVCMRWGWVCVCVWLAWGGVARARLSWVWAWVGGGKGGGRRIKWVWACKVNVDLKVNI